MNLCLVVQKDTLENDKIKSIVRTCENVDQFVSELQAGHCIEYQLLGYTNFSNELSSKLSSIIVSCKTNYGKDWYEFDHNTLAKIISLFLESEKSMVNLKSISSIMGFTLRMYPVVSKEIRVSSVSSGSTAAVIAATVASQGSTSSDVKEEIISLIEDLKGVSELPRRNKKESTKDVKDKDSRKVRKEV